MTISATVDVYQQELTSVKQVIQKCLKPQVEVLEASSESYNSLKGGMADPFYLYNCTEVRDWVFRSTGINAALPLAINLLVEE